jgi:hypothetical protein
MRSKLAELRQHPDWFIAIHEAGHAVVGTAVGGELRGVTGIPPHADVKFGRSDSRRAMLTFAVAGPAAERLVTGRDPTATLEASLAQFFESLGDDSIASHRADDLAAAAEEDDLDLVVPLIDSYSTRRRGLAQFRQARSNAVKLLRDRWDEVEAAAVPIMDQLLAGTTQEDDAPG